MKTAVESLPPLEREETDGEKCRVNFRQATFARGNPESAITSQRKAKDRRDDQVKEPLMKLTSILRVQIATRARNMIPLWRSSMLRSEERPFLSQILHAAEKTMSEAIARMA